MPIVFDLVALQALAADTAANTVLLSPMTITIILAALDIMSDPANWVGADPINGLTDAERDEIDGYTSRIFYEVAHE